MANGQPYQRNGQYYSITANCYCWSTDDLILILLLIYSDDIIDSKLCNEGSIDWYLPVIVLLFWFCDDDDDLRYIVLLLFFSFWCVILVLLMLLTGSIDTIVYCCWSIWWWYDDDISLFFVFIWYYCAHDDVIGILSGIRCCVWLSVVLLLFIWYCCIINLYYSDWWCWRNFDDTLLLIFGIHYWSEEDIQKCIFWCYSWRSIVVVISFIPVICCHYYFTDDSIIQYCFNIYSIVFIILMMMIVVDDDTWPDFQFWLVLMTLFSGYSCWCGIQCWLLLFSISANALLYWYYKWYYFQYYWYCGNDDYSMKMKWRRIAIEKKIFYCLLFINEMQSIQPLFVLVMIFWYDRRRLRSKCLTAAAAIRKRGILWNKWLWRRKQVFNSINASTSSTAIIQWPAWLAIYYSLLWQWYWHCLLFLWLNKLLRLFVLIILLCGLVVLCVNVASYMWPAVLCNAMLFYRIICVMQSCIVWNYVLCIIVCALQWLLCGYYYVVWKWWLCVAWFIVFDIVVDSLFTDDTGILLMYYWCCCLTVLIHWTLPVVVIRWCDDTFLFCCIPVMMLVIPNSIDTGSIVCIYYYYYLLLCDAMTIHCWYSDTSDIIVILFISISIIIVMILLLIFYYCCIFHFAFYLLRRYDDIGIMLMTCDIILYSIDFIDIRWYIVCDRWCWNDWYVRHSIVWWRVLFLDMSRCYSDDCC